jgi:thymidylate synthase
LRQYKELVQDVLENGTKRGDRTGTGTISLFGTQSRYDLRKGFPLVTIKKSIFKSIVKELLWFLRGETNINTLGCKIWDEWADKDGELGPVYGAQWRSWATTDIGPKPTGYSITSFDDAWVYHVDQIANLIKGLKENPLSRRHIVSAWNPAEIDNMALPPCHTMFQMYASEIPAEYWSNESYRSTQDLNINGAPSHFLDLQLYQRSADLALGVPFNIASYALLLTLIAREVNMMPRFFIHTIGDAHIYENHVEGVKEMLSREPLKLPSVAIAAKPMPYPGCARDGSVLEPEDVQLIGYEHHGRIKFPIAV